MRSFLFNFLFFFSLILALPGCETLTNSNNSKSDEYSELSAEQLHVKAKSAMKAENYKKAIKLYETLESRYPFGDYAAQTQLNIAYAYYKNDDPETAIAATDRFIKINPRHPNVDYAYYLKGLINYNRSIGFLERFLPTDSSQRNPTNVKEAFDNFELLTRRFPNSKYAPDAKQRMIALKNNLAMYEVHVARFYLKRKAYIAAANRGSYVVKNYQRTPAVPYALQVMEKAYTKMGLDVLAADAKRVYQQNYPDGPPVIQQRETTFLDKTWELFGFDE